MTLDEQLNLLEDKIRRLKIEFDIFFCGASKKPPYDLRNQIELVLKKLMDEKKMSQAQRFKFNTLTARFYSYRDLWRRIMQAKEEGIILPGYQAPADKVTEEASSSLPSEPVGTKRSSREVTEYSRQDNNLNVQISDPTKQKEKIRELYNFLASANEKLKKKNTLSFEHFSQLVQTKTLELKKELKCNNVTFSIQVDKGKISFRAKPGEDKPA